MAELQHQKMEIPPWFRFKPTDKELIDDFLVKLVKGEALDPLSSKAVLEKKVYGKESAPWEIFSDQDPWVLDDNSKKKVTYACTKVTYKTKNTDVPDRKNICRVAGCGSWWGKSKSKYITDGDDGGGSVIGQMRSFTYKPDGDERNWNILKAQHGHWIMHEYMLSGKHEKIKTDMVICKITKDESKLKRIHPLERETLPGANKKLKVEYDQPNVASTSVQSDLPRVASVSDKGSYQHSLNPLMKSAPSSQEDNFQLPYRSYYSWVREQPALMIAGPSSPDDMVSLEELLEPLDYPQLPYHSDSWGSEQPLPYLESLKAFKSSASIDVGNQKSMVRDRMSNDAETVAQAYGNPSTANQIGQNGIAIADFGETRFDCNVGKDNHCDEDAGGSKTVQKKCSDYGNATPSYRMLENIFEMLEDLKEVPPKFTDGLAIPNAKWFRSIGLEV